MTSEPTVFRIAVRQFGPFESALAKLWAGFCKETSCQLAVEMVPMDLHELHTSLLTDHGLQNGTWDVAHINTDWLPEAASTGALENLTPYIQASPPADFPRRLESVAAGYAATRRRHFGPAFSRWAGVLDLSQRVV